VFETLLRTDESDRITTDPPALCESYDVSPDGKTITLRLRQGIKFHDGTDFDAAAVKYNLQDVLAKNVLGSAVLNKVASYDIVGPHTLRLNLTQYDSTLLFRLATAVIGMMASPTALQKPTTPENTAKDHMVGTGPFIFDSWQRDSFVKFTKNPNYWQKGKPYLNAVEIKTIADQAVSMMTFMAGQADWWNTIDPTDANELTKNGFDVRQTDFQFAHALYPDGANPDSPFANKKVREALEYAIDKEGLAKGIGVGYFQPAYEFATPKDPWYVPGLAPRTYNPAKAKALLAEAGYPNGIQTTLLTDTRVRKDTLGAIQTYLKDAGFNCTLDVADVARITATTRTGWKGILMPGFPTPLSFTTVISRFATPTDYVSMYKPAGWQQKWDAMQAEPDYNKRMALIKELIKTVYDEMMATPYHTDGDRYALIKVNDLGAFAGRVTRWWDAANVWIGK
jgi:ABC-type transport system substrate-binding protein